MKDLHIKMNKEEFLQYFYFKKRKSFTPAKKGKGVPYSRKRKTFKEED